MSAMQKKKIIAYSLYIKFPKFFKKIKNLVVGTDNFYFIFFIHQGVSTTKAKHFFFLLSSLTKIPYTQIVYYNPTYPFWDFFFGKITSFFFFGIRVFILFWFSKDVAWNKHTRAIHSNNLFLFQKIDC